MVSRLWPQHAAITFTLPHHSPHLQKWLHSFINFYVHTSTLVKSSAKERSFATCGQYMKMSRRVGCQLSTCQTAQAGVLGGGFKTTKVDVIVPRELSLSTSSWYSDRRGPTLPHTCLRTRSRKVKLDSEKELSLLRFNNTHMLRAISWLCHRRLLRLFDILTGLLG